MEVPPHFRHDLSIGVLSISDAVDSDRVIANTEPIFGRIDALNSPDVGGGDAQSTGAIQRHQIRSGLIEQDDFLHDGSLKLETSPR